MDAAGKSVTLVRVLCYFKFKGVNIKNTRMIGIIAIF